MKIPCKQKVTEKKPFKTRAKEWFKRNGISLALFCMMVGLMVASSISGAEAINVTKINEKSKITGLDEFPKIAATVVQVIGAVVGLFGGGAVGLGYAQDNPDGQSRGLKFLIGGAIAFSTTTILKWIAFKG